MRERDLFIAALHLRDAAARTAYLEQACGSDRPLHDRVESLLRDHEKIGSFLEDPALSSGNPASTVTAPLSDVATSDSDDSAGTVGAVIAGRYKLVKVIGEGGMGRVYMAQQTEPVQRVVAVKLIRAGMDSRQVLSRFEVERQALALMDHPNIAKVLDAGATPDGRPFFVMELVKGVPITQYCDEQRLTPSQRLELFVPICQAIQHAHQKGVIHRDIKPSNVLVALYDDRPVPKVIDFGVAKATGQSLTENSFQTAFGGIVGTPEYMSPEQASLNNLDIDTRSDVYSMGALLYELLAGSPPFRAAELKKAGLLEILRMVREDEPPTPSSKLSTADALPSLSANRGTEPKKLTGLLRNELDWIVMKALEKDRSRRYETAGGFAADIMRFLAGEVVTAHPPSAGYRLRKFLRRNKGPVLAASLVLLALLAGMAGTTIGLIRAENRRVAAEEARAAEAVQRSRAEAKEEETAAVLDFVEKKIFSAARPKEQDGGLGYDVPLRTAIKASLSFVEKSFPKQPLTEGRLRLTLGNSFYYLGEAETARTQYAAAATLFETHLGPDDKDTLAAKHNLATAYYDLDRYQDAIKLHEDTLARRKATLGPDHKDTLSSANNLGTCYFAVGRHEDALTIGTETLIRLKATLGPDHPVTLASMTNVANALALLNRHSEALKLREETLALQRTVLGPDHPLTLGTMNNLSNSYESLDRHSDALKLREETLALKRSKLGNDHADTLMGMRNLANSHETLGQFDEAVKLCKERLAILAAKHGPDDPKTLEASATVASTLMAANRGAEAIALIDEFLRQAPGKPLDPNLVPHLLQLRKRHFAPMNDAAECLSTVEKWEKLARTDADSLYNAACWRAVTATAYLKAKPPAADAGRLATEQADLAMAWLQKAVAAGYTDASHMAKDSDLDPLRVRADFKQLIADLVEKQTALRRDKPD